MRLGNQSEKEGIVECEKTILFFSDRFSMEVCVRGTKKVTSRSVTEMPLPHSFGTTPQNPSNPELLPLLPTLHKIFQFKCYLIKRLIPIYKAAYRAVRACRKAF